MKSASGRSRAKVAKAALISPLVRVRNGQLIPVPGTAIDYDWIAYALGEDAARMRSTASRHPRTIAILKARQTDFGFCELVFVRDNDGYAFALCKFDALGR